MNVLIVTNNYLDVNGGGSNASRAHINSISKIADACTVLHPLRNKNVFGIESSTVRMIGVLDKRSKIRKFFDLISGRIHRYHGIFSKLLLDLKPDIVIFDGSRCTETIASLAKKAECSIIVIHQNCESIYYRDESLARANTFEKIIIDPFLRLHIAKTEKVSIEIADLNVVLSAFDEDILRKHYNFNKNVRPFVAIGVFEFSNNSAEITTNIPRKDNLVLAITGNLSTPQTENNITNFLKDIYIPHFGNSKNISLLIAGRNPSRKFIDKFDSKFGISLVANPIEISEIIRGADIYVCPADSGGGIKLRVMDGFRVGLPVMAQGISKRGYEAFEARGFLKGFNTDADFFEGITSLQSKIISGDIQRSKVRSLYEENCSFSSGLYRMNNVLALARCSSASMRSTK